MNRRGQTIGQMTTLEETNTRSKEHDLVSTITHTQVLIMWLQKEVTPTGVSINSVIL